MLLLLLLHLFITVSCLWAGYLFYRMVGEEALPGKALIAFAISGLIGLTLLTQIFALFIPIGNTFSLLTFSLLAVSALSMRKAFGRLLRQAISEIIAISFFGKVCLFCLWVIILMLNSGPLIMDDTESYHIQMVQWIEQYGSVPGIANLHERFGFNSSWFSSIAVFHFSFKKINNFTALNGTLSLWFCTYFISLAFNRYKSNAAVCFAALFTLILSFASWPIIRGNAATTNYDYISMLIVVVLCIETYLYASKEQDFNFSSEWLIWPVYLFTVRIINFPLLLISIFAAVYLLRNNRWQRFIVFSFISALLVFPFITRNIIVSGYPFYPSPFMDYFNVDWKTPPEVLNNLLHFIKYYNRVSDGVLGIETTASMDGLTWIPSWFRYMAVYNHIIFIPGIAGIIMMCIAAFKNAKRFFIPNQVIVLSILVWLLCWFFIAPDPRFVHGCLVAGIFFLFIFIYYKMREGMRHKIIKTAAITLLVSILPYVFYKGIRNDSLVNWLIPVALPQPDVKTEQIGGVLIRIPEKINGNWNPRCYGTPLPCLYFVYPGLEPRGNSIRQGFRIKKTNE